MLGFNRAYNELLKYEQGYVNDPDDKGKETYKGISRNYHPEWEGWKYVDKCKESNDFKLCLATNRLLEEEVEKFYKEEYWDKFRGDDLPFVVANELFEQAVNLGTWKTAGTNLQIALNLLNRNGVLFKDLKVDGLVGKNTLRALTKVNIPRLVKVLNGLQFMRYYKLMTENPANEKFVGWFNRI